MSWPTRKYRKGRRLLTLAQVIRLIDAGKWLISRHKPYHPSVISNWSLYTIRSALGMGMYVAVENKRKGL